MSMTTVVQRTYLKMGLVILCAKGVDDLESFAKPNANPNCKPNPVR